MPLENNNVFKLDKQQIINDFVELFPKKFPIDEKLTKMMDRYAEDIENLNKSIYSMLNNEVNIKKHYFGYLLNNIFMVTAKQVTENNKADSNYIRLNFEGKSFKLTSSLLSSDFENFTFRIAKQTTSENYLDSNLGNVAKEDYFVTKFSNEDMKEKALTLMTKIYIENNLVGIQKEFDTDMKDAISKNHALSKVLIQLHSYKLRNGGDAYQNDFLITNDNWIGLSEVTKELDSIVEILEISCDFDISNEVKAMKKENTKKNKNIL